MNHPQSARGHPPFVLAPLALAMLLMAAGAHGAPTGGTVAAGAAGIASSGTRTTITQTTPSAVINWQGFGIAAGESVRFVQPGASSVALNRVLGSDPSAIFGTLSANGQVFLSNPNGVLFGKGASVNVGGLVATTLGISDADFMGGRYTFQGQSRSTVVNHGTLQADGGYVVLLGAELANQGNISARGGDVVLAAGQAVTLDVLGDQLLRVSVDRGAVNAQISNGGVLQADGGRVLLTAQAAGELLSTAVNNTGIIQARTISNRQGSIKLLGDMGSGVLSVAGQLDASAPQGGDGGFIETSAARVQVSQGAVVSTASASGRTGTWLIDPQDFTVGSGATDNISGPTLSALLVTNSVTISTQTGPTVVVPGTPPLTQLNTAVNGAGDITINDAVSWTATPSTTTLTLNAARDVNVNRAITATNGNLVVCCGRDVNVNAAITTTNGSVLLAAGRTATLTTAAAMTTTDGNIEICAAEDVRIGSALSLTRGSSIPAQSLGLPAGMVLNAGAGGTGVGTVVFTPLAPPATVVGPNAPVTIIYNPSSYSAPTNYATNFVTAAPVTQRMLVLASGDKTFDGGTTTVLTGLKGNPAGVTLVAGPGSVANFDTAAVGTAKAIAFTGYTLAGPDAANFALPVACCGPAVAKTTGAILAAVVVPPAPPPVVVPPAPPPGVVPPTPAPPPVVVPPAPPAVVVPPPVVVPPAPPPVIVPPVPVVVVPPVPVAPVPVPVVIVPPPVVVVVPPAAAGEALEAPPPRFLPFVVAPLLLQAPTPLLVVAPADAAPVAFVLAPVPAAVAPAPAAPVIAPAAEAAPVPARAPARPVKPYRN
ncbi:filamentous hemagglutinin N-terminal domain-containing protein [Ramlibacter sp. XY19]|uniref:two-partner secretion domain-containing protein n=1 Tax=Ramlibacter paludis TaxID=2908000 RepID=UPI0023DCA8A7|nr:filamentous hemagglutinin N-terminal domain-containing protein [Ramlibacter paludis]MCG2594973.1 filamentous hemagglutinin N-terminal domain-containing protein [Ramlibacter paludis]